MAEPRGCRERLTAALLAGLDRASPQLRVPGLVLPAGHGGRVNLSVRGGRRRWWGRQVVDLVAGHLEVEPSPCLVGDACRVLVPGDGLLQLGDGRLVLPLLLTQVADRGA